MEDPFKGPKSEGPQSRWNDAVRAGTSKGCARLGIPRVLIPLLTGNNNIFKIQDGNIGGRGPCIDVVGNVEAIHPDGFADTHS